MNIKILLYYLITIFLFIPIIANSQWTSNTSLNTVVCDTTNDQVLPKIARTSDGGCYIGWFDSRSSGYAVYIQKLDANGNRLFAPGGLLISNNPQSSSLVDWDLAVDDSNCCVLAFTDTRVTSNINPYAYRISPTGQFLWGANGITLTDSANVFQPNPKVIVTSDGNFIIAWQYGTYNIGVQKLNKAGAKLWGSIPMIVQGNISIGEKFNYPCGIPSDNGSIILYWCGYTGTFINPSNYKLYTQKFSSTGTRLWSSTQDTIYNLGSVQGTYNPTIYSDGNNGAVYVWQDYRTGNTNCNVQRKSSTGTLLFPVNGSQVASTGYVMLRFEPHAAFMPSTGETYVFWQQKNSLQSIIGVYGQKFSSTGTRLWADSGVAFKPLDANSFASLSATSKDSNVYVYYMEIVTANNNGLAKAFKTDRNGNLGWGGLILTPGAYSASKGRMSTTMNPAGMSILAWSDNRNDGGGIYAQNINLNGTFGTLTGITPIGTINPTQFVLYQNYPNPFNPKTKIKFNIPVDPLSFPNASIGNPYVSMKIYDITGREIQTLVNEQLQAGIYEVTFDGENFSSGIYFYKLSAGEFSDIKKMILIK